MNLSVVILAAGQGTRMRSKTAKVLHPLAGQPMIAYSLDLAQGLGVDQPVVVVGHQGDQVRAAVGARAQLAEQADQRGTGHAVLQARDLLEGKAADVMVLYADMPLLRAETLQALYELHRQSNACLTMLTVNSPDSMGFGRIVRRPDGSVERIVEESEATAEELALRELNCGVYCFDGSWLWDRLPRLVPSPKKGELFLTDLVEIASAQGKVISVQKLGDMDEVVGINNRAHLARAEQIVRDRISEKLMLSGVTLLDPAHTYIDASVQIAPDSIILPGSHITGNTRIGSDCRIGPNAEIHDCNIGDRCEIGASVLEGSTLEDEVHVGPFCHVRPGCVLSTGVHLGDHAELKKARLGPDSKMGHFSYLGDAEVGARVNIGAGTITCNYDGKNKHRTIIKDDVFIGSDTLLVAPVTVGARARTGAGTVVTHDLPPDTLSVGVPSRVIRQLAPETATVQEGS